MKDACALAKKNQSDHDYGPTSSTSQARDGVYTHVEDPTTTNNVEEKMMEGFQQSDEEEPKGPGKTRSHATKETNWGVYENMAFEEEEMDTIRNSYAEIVRRSIGFYMTSLGKEDSKHREEKTNIEASPKRLFAQATRKIFSDLFPFSKEDQHRHTLNPVEVKAGDQDKQREGTYKNDRQTYEEVDSPEEQHNHLDFHP